MARLNISVEHAKMPFSNMEGKRCFSVTEERVYKREKEDTKYDQNEDPQRDILSSQRQTENLREKSTVSQKPFTSVLTQLASNPFRIVTD